MEWIQSAVDLFLHVDQHLTTLVGAYSGWVYALLFVIVFCETGLVVTPFLPGDSLLFAAGAIAATGALDVGILFVGLTTAAIVGDSVNYWIGGSIGVRLARRGSRWLKPEYLEMTERFYARHGAKTLVLARFAPIVRTFAPFMAGMGRMHYGTFATYNVVGAVVWVTLFLFGGYLFGNLPMVRENFEWVAIAIVVLSVVPGIVGAWKHHRSGRAPAVAAGAAGD